MTNTVNIGLLKKQSGDFLAITFPYHPELVARVKRLDDRRYDSVNRRWIVSLNQLPMVKELFPEASITDGIKTIESLNQKETQKASEDFREVIEGIDLDEPLPNGKTLFQHQKESVLRMLKYRRQILALDMGLGKTLTSLVAAKILNEKNDYIILIICPVSLMDNWKREANSLHLQNFSVHSWSKLPQPIHKEYIVIADEAHYAQAGTKSQRGKAFLELCKSAFCVASYSLSGTPMKNGRPINLLPLLEAARHALARDKRYFQIRYCNAHATQFTRWDVNGARNLDELNLKTKDALIRRTKKECLDLPEKMRVMREAELSTEAEKLYKKTLNDLKESYQQRVKAGEIIGDSEALVMLGYYRQAGSIAKTETALELALEVIEEGNSIAIFSFFRKPLQHLYDSFKKQNIKTELLMGDSVDRQGMVDRFQRGESKVFLLSMAGGVGIDLYKANTIILIDRPWTPGDTEQIEDRLHRIGQVNAVTAIWLQYGEIDAKIDKIIQAKQENIELVLEGKRKTVSKSNLNKMAKEFLNTAFNTKELF